ncbi:MAG: TolC family protein [Candidatus Marinimicrobia bacterium]|nr:TolC family protein [Candidatus Neomarinimicrobiota bacterium]
MKSLLYLFCFLPFVNLNAQVYSLADCIEIALLNKESLKSVELDVQSAIAGKKGSLSNILPTFSYGNSWSESYSTKGVNTSETVFMGDTLSFSTPFGGTSNNYGASFSVNQPIYDGGQWLNQIRSANNSLVINQQLARQQKINVILNVHQSFYEFLKAQQLLDVSKKNLTLARHQVSLVKTQFELGAVKKTDLLKAQVLKGNAHSDVLIKETNLLNANLALRNSMGLVGSDTHYEIVDTGRPFLPVPDVEQSMSEVVEYSPTLLVFRSQIAGAELSRKILFGTRLPNLNASMNYGILTNDFDNMTQLDDWSSSVSLSLSVPIFTGYSLSTKQQQAELNVRKQRYDYLTQKHDLMVQLENLINILGNYQELIPISEQVLASAEEDLNLVQERYKLGSTTILEVLDAQVSVSQARSSLVSTKYNARIQEAQLRAILGTLDQDYR